MIDFKNSGDGEETHEKQWEEQMMDVTVDDGESATEMSSSKVQKGQDKC